MIKRIGILTSGGDAPGMNAAIRAAALRCIGRGIEPVGIHGGYQGIFDENMKPLKRSSLATVLALGGTVLKTSRCQAFRTPEGRAKAFEILRSHMIDALIVIGGDGSFQGARAIAQEHDFKVMGIPGTIDNDLYGTDFTIGYDTAVNTAVTAIDKIRDTAESHTRIFFVEVMGRDSGYIAVATAIGSAANAVAIPEDESSVSKIVEQITHQEDFKKRACLIITAEGKTAKLVHKVMETLASHLDNSDDSLRYFTLGHIQRGGSPTMADRILASQMGAGAVDGLLDGKQGMMVGVMKNELVYHSLTDSIEKTKPIDPRLAKLVDWLS